MADRFADIPGRIRTRPLAWTFLVLAIVAMVRFVEVGAGVHEIVGALVVSPVLVLCVAVLFSIVQSPVSPGGTLAFDRSRLRDAVLVGIAGVLAVQLVAALVQVLVLTVQQSEPSLVIEPVDPVSGDTAETTILAALVLGVVVTAVGEELLFRGVLLDGLATRMSLPQAVGVQALCFGLWHLAWPLALAVGPASPPVPLPVHALGFVVVTGFVGGVYAVLAWTTGSLWTAIFAHLVHNVSAVFVHVQAGGTDRARTLAVALVLGYTALAWLAWWRSGQWHTEG
jgi:membrane protease YdiL (CAAX protease family)